jgi:hypothetical protein
VTKRIAGKLLETTRVPIVIEFSIRLKLSKAATYCFAALAEVSRAFCSERSSGMDSTQATPSRLMMAGREKNNSPCPIDVHAERPLIKEP